MELRRFHVEGFRHGGVCLPTSYNSPDVHDYPWAVNLTGPGTFFARYDTITIASTPGCVQVFNEVVVSKSVPVSGNVCYRVSHSVDKLDQ